MLVVQLLVLSYLVSGATAFGAWVGADPVMATGATELGTGVSMGSIAVVATGTTAFGAMAGAVWIGVDVAIGSGAVDGVVVADSAARANGARFDEDVVGGRSNNQSPLYGGILLKR
ncbi:hypothetical protein SNE40_004907 [Patella caerulea]|uniref:Uncharacterized protein n=1 Tax=Patella caerulea TaxID=87958 RepID=A0AAN8KD13_PATCE